MWVRPHRRGVPQLFDFRRTQGVQYLREERPGVGDCGNSRSAKQRVRRTGGFRFGIKYNTGVLMGTFLPLPYAQSVSRIAASSFPNPLPKRQTTDLPLRTVAGSAR